MVPTLNGVAAKVLTPRTIPLCWCWRLMRWDFTAMGHQGHPNHHADLCRLNGTLRRTCRTCQRTAPAAVDTVSNPVGLKNTVKLSIMLNWSAAFVWFLFQIVKTYKTWLQWAKHCKSWTVIGWIPLWQNLVSWHKRALVNSYLSIGNKICRYNRYNMVQHGTIVPNANGRKSKWNLGWKVSTVSTKHAKTSATTENGFSKWLDSQISPMHTLPRTAASLTKTQCHQVRSSCHVFLATQEIHQKQWRCKYCNRSGKHILSFFWSIPSLIRCI